MTSDTIHYTLKLAVEGATGRQDDTVEPSRMTPQGIIAHLLSIPNAPVAIFNAITFRAGLPEDQVVALCSFLTEYDREFYRACENAGLSPGELGAANSILVNAEIIAGQE